MTRVLIAFFTLALAVASGAGASELDEDNVTKIIRSLAPTNDEQTYADRPKKPKIELIVTNSVIVLDPNYSLDFEVFFDFNSDLVTPKAREALEFLGRALESDALKARSYLVSGHTDAKGSANYNLELSTRRASAVTNYLIENFAIEPDRLVAVGLGETRLKVPDMPTAGINRRVEVALIVSRERK